jgi:hypothetical protein
MQLSFTNAQIISYFVSRTASDGLPVNDFKSVNRSAMNLFRCGHIQKIELCNNVNSHTIYLRASCLPEMRKDRKYDLYMELDDTLFEIKKAQCGCPAGCGPKGSCKHLAALCYALEDFTRVQQLPDFLTSTDRLQTWNRPRPHKLAPIPVEEMRTRKEQLMPPKFHSSQDTRRVSQFDPRPEEYRRSDPKCESLRCQLLQLNTPCAFTHLLIPQVDKIFHDHTYCSPCFKPIPSQASQATIVQSDLDARILPQDILLKAKENFNISDTIRMEIEHNTRNQSSSSDWHHARLRRITGSICGQIIKQKRKTVPLLCRVLYPKPLILLPRPIAWGIQNEPFACASYRKYMNESGHVGLSTSPVGFVIDKTKGWLGASPDTRVNDPSCADKSGIAEFKCPYTKRDESPQQSCYDKDFFCEMIDGQVQLKQSCSYYHQVQLQLYVGRDLYNWCDFCVYTPVGISVQRIYPNKEWQVKYIPELEEFYDKYVLPEIIKPLHKPAYFL